ncbi:MAG: RrF2 family transcriptional regulator [Mangrovibacterium sp.]
MIAKSTEYAIRALVYIQLKNQEGKRPGKEEIAKEIDAPEAFSAKILQTLTRHRLITSMKGRGGGFFFTGEQASPSLFDVIRLLEGDAFFHKCGFGLKQCSDDNPCPLHDRYKSVREAFYQIVQTESILSLSEKVITGKAVLNRML